MAALNQETINTLRVPVKTIKKERGSCYSSMESDEEEFNDGQRDQNQDLPEFACISEENDEGIVTDQVPEQTKAATETELDQEALKKLEITMELEHSFKLFRPLTTLTYVSGDNCLISGSFGMVYIWDTTNDLIKQSLPVAGEVVSLDTWTDCLAVGSEVVQIIQLKSKGPKRTIYAKKGELMPKTKPTRYMVAFVGDKGYLASAKVEGDTISIWPPSPEKSYAVTKSLFDMDVKGSSIVSMTASKDPDNPWVAAVTSIPGSGQPHETLHLWDCTSWTAKAPQIYIEPEMITPPTSAASYKIYSSFLHSGRNIAIGNGRELCIWKCENGQLLTKKTLENDCDITCLTCKSDSQHNFIAVCTNDGTTRLYDTEKLHELCRIPTNQNAYAIHVSQNETSFLFVNWDDTLQIWNDQIHANDETVTRRYCLGMELCSEGILSQRKMLQINESQPLNLSFDEHDVHLELPQEVLQEKLSLEVAFVPYNNAGPFEFPKGVIPVSPLVWFCLHPPRSIATAFTSPTSVKLPLCFDCNLSKDIIKSLHFMKAEHKDITVSEDGQTVVKFNLVDQTETQFQPNSPYGVLRDHHFCINCVGYSGLRESIQKKVRYCLTIQKPIAFPKGEKKEIHCILHYNLPGCRNLIKQQMPEDYVMLGHSETLQFDRPEAALELEVDKVEAQGKGWTIALVSKKLFTEDVNFFNLYELGTLESDCDDNKYPPRMVIEVSSDCNNAVFPSVINLSFTGARRSFSKEISLICPLNENHLHALDNERQDQGSGPSDRQPHPFLAGPPST